MAKFKTDIEIARAARKKPIQEVGKKLGIAEKDLVPYGHDKAKVSQEFIEKQEKKAAAEAKKAAKKTPEEKPKADDAQSAGEAESTA